MNNDKDLENCRGKLSIKEQEHKVCGLYQSNCQYLSSESIQIGRWVTKHKCDYKSNLEF